jgi:hypothetical protein
MVVSLKVALAPHFPVSCNQTMGAIILMLLQLGSTITPLRIPIASTSAFERNWVRLDYIRPPIREIASELRAFINSSYFRNFRIWKSFGIYKNKLKRRIVLTWKFSKFSVISTIFLKFYILDIFENVFFISVPLVPYSYGVEMLFNLWIYTQSVGLPSQGCYLHTEQHKHRISAHNTDIHALSGIRTYDPSVRATEDSLCLRKHSHCDRHVLIYK